MPSTENSAKFQNRKFILAGIFIFLFFFALYLSCSFLLSKTSAFTWSGLLFETDTTRVIGDMVNPAADHYRTKVHPLFVLLTNPLGSPLTRITGSEISAAILLNSFIGAIATLLAFMFFRVLTHELLESVLLTGLFGVSASQFFFSAIPETSALAVCSLLVTYILFLNALKSGRIQLLLWVAAGVFTLAVTTTNFIQTCICFMIVTLVRAPKKNRLIHTGGRMIVFIVFTITCTILLAGLQKSLYPSSRLFYTLEFYEEETLYTSFVVLETPLIVISQLARHFFLVNIIAPPPTVFPLGESYIAITFSRALNYSMLGWATVALWAYLFITSLIQLFKKKETFSLTVSFTLTLCLLFNLALHSIYGIGSGGSFEYFLYTGNFTFLALSFISYYMQPSNLNNRILLAILTALVSINNLITLATIMNIYR